VWDCYSKKVLGYAMAHHMEASLVCDALKMAARSGLVAVAHALNTRPRKRLAWQTPAEALNKYLQSTQQQHVATTD
jgi:transposase InsO family protein